MNSNITDVIEALNRSKDNVPKDWASLEQNEEIMFQVMEMEYQEKPLSSHLGVSKDVFPKLEELEEDEVKEIVEKIRETWAVYNYYADLPEGLPIRIAYDVLLSVWDDVVACYPFGNCHFDFHDRDLEQFIKN